MGDLRAEIRKHIRVALFFMRSQLAAQMEYRANFFTGIAMEIGYLLVKLMYVLVVYRAGVNVNGLAPDEILLFSGTFILMTGIYAGLIMMNLFDLRRLIRDGALDLYITKPVSLQFMITMRRSDLGLLLVDGVAGLALITVALVRLGSSFPLWRLFGFAGYLVAGGMAAYGLFVLPNLLGFWFPGADFAVFTDPFWDFNSVPMGIYNRVVQDAGMVVIPIFLITNFPALYLMDRLTPFMSVWGFTAPVLLLVLTRLVFRRAIRRYESASG